MNFENWWFKVSNHKCTKSPLDICLAFRKYFINYYYNVLLWKIYVQLVQFHVCKNYMYLLCTVWTWYLHSPAATCNYEDVQSKCLSLLVRYFLLLVLTIWGHFCNQSLQFFFCLFNILLTLPDNGNSSTSDASLFQCDERQQRPPAQTSLVFLSERLKQDTSTSRLL